MISLKQEFEFYDYLGPLAVAALFALILLAFSFLFINFFMISRKDEPTVFEKAGLKHHVRLGRHHLSAVQRYQDDLEKRKITRQKDTPPNQLATRSVPNKASSKVASKTPKMANSDACIREVPQVKSVMEVHLRKAEEQYTTEIHF
ncbi:hypothetical protein AB6A40_002136 [Gnathostoma spinigerum]|uniref:Uncharacterized protein n=1 Tax=Gnathostoma spinigerum TaxID=75299 RepID=A0ABD6EFV1_9BILA